MTSAIMKPDDITKSDEAKANPRAAMARVKPRKSSAYSGQRKHDLRNGPQPAYVNEKLSELNTVIIESPKPSVLRQLCNERRGQRTTERTMRSDSAVAFIGIIAFGKEAQALFLTLSPEDQDTAYFATAKAIADRMGTTLEGLVSHRDETAPHAHFTCPAYNLDGIPLTSTVKRGMLYDIQTITAEVMGQHCEGIERGKSRIARLNAGADYADTVNKSVKELHQTLPADIEKKRAELNALAGQIATAQASYDEMLGRVEKLTEKAELNEKEEKRLGIYDKRLGDRETVLKEAEARLVDQQAAFQAQQNTTKADAERTRNKEQTKAQDAQKLAKEETRKLEEGKRQLKTDELQLETDRAEYKAMALENIAQFSKDQDTLDKERADLEAREAKFTKRVGLFFEIKNQLDRMINRIGKALGLSAAKSVMDALDQIDKMLPDLVDPEIPKPESGDAGAKGPGS
jgi:hypothetical protein